ncbi:uromodulin-like [Pocillopora verrucosa]|uniref:uromodulin-like n=1 Tax=Pocillopora verrucosa TaxID=203993 RepID=UPI0033418DAC
MAFVTANDQYWTEEKIQCKTEVNIHGMALKRSVFKRWSVAAPHLCDVKCGQEITCQSYNYNKKYQTCELNNRTKEARPENFLLAPTWFYIRRLNGRAPLGSIPELPALSCLEIKASEGNDSISGNFWLDPTGTGKAVLIDCDMASGDMDECKSDISDCDVNANCTNTDGSYKCKCKAGYTGDGHSCSANPCYHYQSLSDASRKSSYKTPQYQEVCDDQLPEEWYRFVGAAGTKMPTTRVPAFRCGTNWPGWLDGVHPTVEDGKVNRKVCFNDINSDCKAIKNISVINCGSYFIYKLFRPPDCFMRYCATD